MQSTVHSVNARGKPLLRQPSVAGSIARALVACATAPSTSFPKPGQAEPLFASLLAGLPGFGRSPRRWATARSIGEII
jgi:hypothetical protein